MERFFDSIIIPNLVEADVAMLEAHISSDKITEAINSLQSNTAPSQGGFTLE